MYKEKEKAEVILHPNFFQNVLVQSAEKLAKDECYPPKIRTEFKNFKIACIEESNPAYSLIKNIIHLMEMLKIFTLLSTKYFLKHQVLLKILAKTVVFF